MDENEKTFDLALEASRESLTGAGQASMSDIADESAENGAEQVSSEEEALKEEPQEENFAQAEANIAEEAISTAEQAAAAFQQKNDEVQELSRLLEEEKKKNAALLQQNEEMNAQREAEVIEETLVPPVLDITAIAFESPEVQAEAQRKYAEEMALYQKKVMEKDYQPYIERAKKADELETIESVKEQVAGDKRFAGFSDMMPRLQKIIKNNKALSNSDVPLSDKLIQAYAVARGVDAMEAPEPEPAPEMTTDEFVEKYKANPDFRNAIESLRIAELNDGQQVPPLSSSSGSGNVALNIKEKPKSMSEALERAKSRFAK